MLAQRAGGPGSILSTTEEDSPLSPQGVTLIFEINQPPGDPHLDPSEPSYQREGTGNTGGGGAFGRGPQAASLMHKTERPIPPQLIKTSGPETADEAFKSFPLQMRWLLCRSLC